MPTPPRRRWYRLGLATLFAFVTSIAAWLWFPNGVVDCLVLAGGMAVAFWVVTHASPIYIEHGATRIPSRQERRAWPKGAMPPFGSMMLVRAALLAAVLCGLFAARGSTQQRITGAGLLSLPILVDAGWATIRRLKNKPPVTPQS